MKTNIKANFVPLYLVTEIVYDKLLQCLQHGDKNIISRLNNIGDNIQGNNYPSNITNISSNITPYFNNLPPPNKIDMSNGDSGNNNFPSGETVENNNMEIDSNDTNNKPEMAQQSVQTVPVQIREPTELVDNTTQTTNDMFSTSTQTVNDVNNIRTQTEMSQADGITQTETGQVYGSTQTEMERAHGSTQTDDFPIKTERIKKEEPKYNIKKEFKRNLGAIKKLPKQEIKKIVKQENKPPNITVVKSENIKRKPQIRIRTVSNLNKLPPKAKKIVQQAQIKKENQIRQKMRDEHDDAATESRDAVVMQRRNVENVGNLENIAENDENDNDYTDVEDEQAEEPERFVCDICGYSLKSRYNLERHKRNIHEVGMPEDVIETEESKNRYICHECGEMFSLEAGLQNHLINIHKHAKVKREFTSWAPGSRKRRYSKMHPYKSNNTQFKDWKK